MQCLRRLMTQAPLAADCNDSSVLQRFGSKMEVIASAPAFPDCVYSHVKQPIILDVYDWLTRTAGRITKYDILCLLANDSQLASTFILVHSVLLTIPNVRWMPAESNLYASSGVSSLRCRIFFVSISAWTMPLFMFERQVSTAAGLCTSLRSCRLWRSGVGYITDDKNIRKAVIVYL